ncbi:MAG: hypothetical protein QGI10_11415 [Vicinamibacterales bacterium]|nr:hypothetical protein [Vicinamibacterales bacterium]MDP7479864.1 hypothetical protein [Vicinamibacterales bacterium]MDP7691965.1 hypothetical protein [Vicinamibacterales bacterium]HJN42934.1 hypothetical protein [Vicinamibacterales bacterium]
MDVALATVTVISLSMAFAMGVVTWRLMREERLRSDARVAALMADLDRARGRDVGAVGQPASRARDVATPVQTTEPNPPRRRSVPAMPASTPARSAGSRLAPAAPEARPATALFGTQAGSPALLRRILATAAAAALVLAAVALGMLSSNTPSDPGTGSTPEPVELLSLAHAREGEYLEITGSIRNPPAGIEREQLSVMATVFDRNGTVVGTGQTPLPVSVLAPGGETPFTILLPDADRINRYRISFMQGHTNVPHVDRRTPGGQARSTTPSPWGARL